MAGPNLGLPPHNDEIEVSVFGPGYGESILVHLGQQDWMVVDSCLDLAAQQPAALVYLQSLGIDLAKAVKLIVATHWHDDHVRGLGVLLESCQAAQFVCSGALCSNEFLTPVEALGRRSLMTSSGVQEFYRIIDVLRRRQEAARQHVIETKWALAERLLWQQPCTVEEHSIAREVYSLSPSDAAVTLAFREMARLLPQEKTPKRGVVAQTSNHVAVMLWVKIGDLSLLLGSDLQETQNPGTGWSVIVSSTTRPPGRASVFKVPHHGSENADQLQVWTEMLEAEPTAVLTPFVRGHVYLPTEADAARLCSRTTRAYATAEARRSQVRQRSKAVERTLRETVRNIRMVYSSQGHVRLRTSMLTSEDSNWRVELFGDALPLRQMYRVG